MAALIGLVVILGIIILIAGAVLLIVSLAKAPGRRAGSASEASQQDLPMWTPPQHQDVPMWTPPQHQDVPLWSPPQQHSAQQPQDRTPPYWSPGPR
ncbi:MULTISPECIES: hypothetical protein [Nocardia]|uniref:hypothetical protein n=1 Tax=Nocardia TaxID=1817 RepID=UPI0007E96D35|nr:MULTISPECIES: hypothetical protein [Nocardia]MBF6271878.1 hypothetical protein [Nocardia nova]OBA42417.1 hypothetical protein A5789_13585 [Nocardia sp. 852002-51101_SCH5132738]OBF76618.1 hypothetical protein A9X06_24580 [Mycobacterium sp. 852002-51759_SCH5129042]PPJ07217.1 hypothetical protein C5E51_18775 [Nocardia nova]